MLLPDVLGPSLFVVSSSCTSDESRRWFWFVTTTELSTYRACPVPNSVVPGSVAYMMLLDGRTPVAVSWGPWIASCAVVLTSPNLCSM